MNSRVVPRRERLFRFLPVAVALVLAGATAACTAGREPRPDVMPQNAIGSTSPDDLPPTETSGLGTPGGDEDAGIPRMPMDGSVPHGNGQVP